MLRLSEDNKHGSLTSLKAQWKDQGLYTHTSSAYKDLTAINKYSLQDDKKKIVSAWWIPQVQLANCKPHHSI